MNEVVLISPFYFLAIQPDKFLWIPMWDSTFAERACKALVKKAAND